jgi:hypothetical protein
MMRRCASPDRRKANGAGKRTAKICSKGRGLNFSGPPYDMGAGILSFQIDGSQRVYHVALAEGVAI